MSATVPQKLVGVGVAGLLGVLIYLRLRARGCRPALWQNEPPPEPVEPDPSRPPTRGHYR